MLHRTSGQQRASWCWCTCWQSWHSSAVRPSSQRYLYFSYSSLLCCFPLFYLLFTCHFRFHLYLRLSHLIPVFISFLLSLSFLCFHSSLPSAFRLSPRPSAMPTRLSGQCGASDLVAGGTHARGAGEEGAAVGRALRGAPPLHSEVGNGLSVPPPPGRPTGPPPCLLPHRARPQRRPPQVQGTHAIYIYIIHAFLYMDVYFFAQEAAEVLLVYMLYHIDNWPPSTGPNYISSANKEQVQLCSLLNSIGLSVARLPYLDADASHRISWTGRDASRGTSACTYSTRPSSPSSAIPATRMAVSPLISRYLQILLSSKRLDFFFF